MATIGSAFGNVFNAINQANQQTGVPSSPLTQGINRLATSYNTNPSSSNILTTGGPTGYGGMQIQGPGTSGGIPTIDQRYQSNYGISPMQMGQTLYNQWANTLGQAPNVPQLSDSFWNAQQDNMMNSLRNEFFNPGGTMDQSMANESAAGRLGSGTGLRMLQQTVTQPFTEAAQNINNTILQSRLQNMQQTSQLNAQFQAQYQDLAARSAQADAGTLSQDQLSQLDADLRAYEAQLQAQTSSAGTQEQLLAAQMQNQIAQQQNAINFLNAPIQYSPGTVGIGNTLSGQFGGGPIGTPGSISVTSPNSNIQGTFGTGAPMGVQNNPGFTQAQAASLPQYGQFYGQLVKGSDGANYMWSGYNWMRQP